MPARRATAATLAACAVWLAMAPAARAAQPVKIETPIASLAPDAGQVLESYVSLYAPLPRADGPHPAACDRIGYLRFRSAGGPADPARADAIFVAQPGIFEGPAAFDQVARHTVEAAAAAGYHVEFWALNPRANCLVDPTGITAAQAARDPNVALDYYFRGTSVDGRTFAGFISESDATWLGHVGLAQTLDDEYAVISQLPPAFRRTRVLCGGHSLGGIVTGAFADWDFSGDRRPGAAGYNQCAGYFALDTRFSLSVAALSTLDDDATADGPLSGLIGSLSDADPYIDFPPITPETLQALPILGMASYFDPTAPSTLIGALPDDPTFNLSLDLLLADSWPDFVADNPNPRSFNLTNQAAIGFVFGDVSDPIGILRASIGVPTGGPVVEKTFPVPYGAPSELMGLLGGNDLVAPPASSAGPGGPLYGWLNYDQVPSPGPAPADDPGQPHTSAASEVSDVMQLSRALFDAGVPFTEEYFPTRLLLDLSAAALGVRTGSLRDLAYTDGIAIHPAAYVDASQGLAPSLGPPPPGAAPQVHVTAEGYNHLDVLVAAAHQNDGQPEVASSTLATWMGEIVGQP
jgi:hypothetical protein